MKKRFAKILSLALALIMVLSVLPTAALAQTTGTRRASVLTDWADWIIGWIIPRPKPRPTYPAQTLSFEGRGGTLVSVDAPAGALPANTSLEINDTINATVLQDAYDRLADERGTVLKAVDISFLNSTGNEVEPRQAVTVTLSSDVIAELDEFTLVHFDCSADELGNSNVHMEVIEDCYVSGSTVTFEATDFSVYAVIGDPSNNGDNARATVNFRYSDGSIIATMYVKNSDGEGEDSQPIENVVFDPGLGNHTIDEQHLFKGWSIDTPELTTDGPNYSGTTKTYDIVQIRNYLKTLTFNEGDVVDIYAMIFKVINVVFLDEDDVAVHSDQLLIKDGDSISYTIDQVYVPADPDENFEGWHAFTNPDSITPEQDKYDNPTTVTLTKSVTFVPQMPGGNWLSFAAVRKGASYTPPQYIHEGDTPEEPEDPTCVGYEFKGWYDNEAYTGDPFDFTQELTGRTNLWAKWEPVTTANYTVIIWRDNLNSSGVPDGYDFMDAITLSGTVGQTINTVSQRGSGKNTYARVNGTDYQYPGFSIRSIDQNVEIKPEGNAVLNVYFQRNQYTYHFYTNTSWTRDNDGYRIPQTTRTEIHSFDAYFEADISAKWNFTGSNGESYTNTYSYNYTTYNESWADATSANLAANGSTNTYFNTWVSKRITFEDSMDAADKYFVAVLSRNTQRHFYYYTEALPGESVDFTRGNTNYHLHKYLLNDFNYVSTDLDFFSIEGYNKEMITNSNGDQITGIAGGDGTSWSQINVGNGQASTLHFLYTLATYAISFQDGKYVDSDNNDLDDYTNVGPLGSPQGGLKYGADVSSYNSYKPTTSYPGITFLGWYADIACTTPYTFTTMPKGGVVVYAKWILNEYRIFLDPMVDKSDTSLEWVNPETSMCFKVDEGEKLGGGSMIQGLRAQYELVGWYIDPQYSRAFNFDAYAIGEQLSIMEDYDQTEPTELDDYGEPTEGNEHYNKDAELNRFWITKCLHLYAKWRSKIEGADGITVIYDATSDGHFVDSTGNSVQTRTDPMFYKPDTKAIAQNAPVCDKFETNEDGVKVEYRFTNWLLMTYNKDTGEFDETDIRFYPGDSFDILMAMAEQDIISSHERPVYDNEGNPVVDDEGNPVTETVIVEATYTIKVVAEYDKSEIPDNTHIYWFSNNGSNQVQQNEKLQINQAIDIPTPTTFFNGIINANGRDGVGSTTGLEYEDHVFLGWAKVTALPTLPDEPTEEQQAAYDAAVAARETKIAGLNESDIFLRWVTDDQLEAGGKYQAEYPEDSETWVDVSKVAADEVMPYDDLVAVWGSVFYVYHSSSNSVEKVVFTSKAPFDITSRTTPGYLYGGYYKGYKGVSTNFTGGKDMTWTEQNPVKWNGGSLDLEGMIISQVDDKDSAKEYHPETNTLVDWDGVEAYEDCGLELQPVANMTYYLKEVNADKYLRARLHYTYKKGGDQHISTAWLMSDVDVDTYSLTGFMIQTLNGNEVTETRYLQANVAPSVTIVNSNGGQSQQITPQHTSFGVGANGTGYVTYALIYNYGDYGDPIAPLLANDQIVSQYWVTPDGCLVTGKLIRSYTGMGEGNMGVNGGLGLGDVNSNNNANITVKKYDSDTMTLIPPQVITVSGNIIMGR